MSNIENHQLDNAPASGDLAPDERETSFTFDDSSPICYCFTSNKALIKKLDGYVKDYPDIYKCTKHHGHSAFYEFPKKYIGVKCPPKTTPEQRKAAAERLQKYRKNRSKEENE